MKSESFPIQSQPPESKTKLNFCLSLMFSLCFLLPSHPMRLASPHAPVVRGHCSQGILTGGVQEKSLFCYGVCTLEHLIAWGDLPPSSSPSERALKLLALLIGRGHANVEVVSGLNGRSHLQPIVYCPELRPILLIWELYLLF